MYSSEGCPFPISNLSQSILDWEAGILIERRDSQSIHFIKGDPRYNLKFNLNHLVFASSPVFITGHFMEEPA
jgi:hypothetical protein